MPATTVPLRAPWLHALAPPPAFRVCPQLPCSKSDVFDDRSLSLGEKRTLMKFLQFSLDLKESSSAEFSPAATGGADAATAAGPAAASAADVSEAVSVTGVDGSQHGLASPESPSDAAAIPASVSGSLRSLNERVLGLGRSLLR